MVEVIWQNKRLDKMLSESVSVFCSEHRAKDPSDTVT